MKNLTKRFHKCDDKCKINHAAKVVPSSKKDNIDIIIEKKINAPAHTRRLAKKTEVIIELMEIVDKINNENETNKVLEKTLITLRKLQKDIA